ncbi:uncharacterized protein LOC126858071 [Cataglyphis hispanica]|uniref:uncharacterized protein LOC126858071 n=1 Tax=Cataglyphis hispanica TaxID=1086592 RepID=UPI00218054D9|nr:uncharacterized protein LOC126858071 [Cataglyphis hispanica]
MSRQVPSYTLLHISLFLCLAIIFINARCVDSFSDHCSELIQFDIDEIEDHLSKLNLTDVPTVKMMVAGFKCPISALPFGTLKSDWSRLLLLQEAQPDGSIIKRKLIRLMRILIVAYYQMEERFDTTDSDVIREKETETTVSDDADKQFSSSNSDWINETSSNDVALHDSYPQSFPITVSVKNDHSRIESQTAESFSSSSHANSVVPFEIKLRYQNVTSPTDLTPYRTSEALNARNATFKVLDNCLKQSLNDIARRQPNHRQVFEILRNKAKYMERAARTGNEIDDYGKYRTKISLPTNEFWRYVTFPTDASPTIPGVAKRVHRMRRLNGFRTSLRKSRKHAKSDGDINENLRQFYGVEKNEAGVKKYTRATEITSPSNAREKSDRMTEK